MIKPVFGILLALLCATLALAQTPPPATAPGGAGAMGWVPSPDDKFLASFIDDQTIAVAHLDASKLAAAAMDKYVASLLDDAKVPADDSTRQELAAARAMADVFLARFKQLGGRHVYALLSHPDLWPHQQPLAVLFKIEPGGDAAALKELLTSTFGMARATPGEPGPQELAAGTPEAVMLRADVLFIGQDAALKRLQSLKPQPRPELALVTSDAPLEVVAALTADERRALAELMPTLPPEVGGGSTEFLTRTVITMRLLVQLPPKPSVTLSFTQPQPSPGWVDPAATRNVYTGATSVTSGTLRIRTSWPVPELDALIIKLRDLLLASDEFKQVINDPDLKSLAPDLSGFVKDLLTLNDSTLQITGGKLDAFLRLDLVILSKAQVVAQRNVSAANLRGIAQSACIYAADNKDMLPPSLDVMVANGQLAPKQLINPDDPKHRRYVYRVIIPESNTDASVPLAWEEVDDDVSGLNVAFGDGHVEWVKNRKELDTYIKNAEVLKTQLDAQRKAREAQTQPAPH